MTAAAQQAGVQQVFQVFQQAFWQEAQLKAISDALRGGLPANREIVIAANPKTGSSLLFHAIARILDRPQTQVVYSFDNPEQDLYLPQLARDCLLRTGVAKLHFCATPANVALLRAFHIAPIVQIRNLFDVIVSARDHMVKDLSDSSDQSDVARSIRSLEPSEQLDAIIDLHVAWYMKFYASWRGAEDRGDLELHWIDYRDLIADQKSVVCGALDFLGVEYAGERVEAVLDELKPKETRFNVGRAGRGEELLSGDQKARVRRMAGYYSDTDFSAIGVG